MPALDRITQDPAVSASRGNRYNRRRRIATQSERAGCRCLSYHRSRPDAHSFATFTL